MSSETPNWNESLRTLWVSSTLSCLAKAKLFLGESLGDGREEDDKGEEDRRRREQRLGYKENPQLTHTHSLESGTSMHFRFLLVLVWSASHDQC